MSYLHDHTKKPYTRTTNRAERLKLSSTFNPRSVVDVMVSIEIIIDLQIYEAYEV